MKKNKICSIAMISLFFMISILPVSSLGTDGNQSQTSDMSISEYDIIIPDNYLTIQEGIDNANAGYKIFVRSGIYEENIVVDKERLTIKGENKNNTFIDARKNTHDAVTITAEGVIFENFTVTNARNEDKLIWDQAGIKIYSSNITIKNNKLIDNRIGVEVYSKAYNLTIIDNEFYDDGILLGNYMNSEGPIITMKDYIHNIENNTVMGKPLYYCTDKNDFTVPSDAGIIILVNCTNVTIRDLEMGRNDFSIILAYCYNCLIENVTISDTDGEVLLFECENNTIRNNTISNTLKAICLEYNSKNNDISYNDVSNNYAGISLFSSARNNTIYKNKAYKNEAFGMEIVSYSENTTQQGNIVSENQFYDNKIGLYLTKNSIENIIKHNSITNNKIGIVLQKSSNYNIIENNHFSRCLLPAVFTDCKENYWNHNYWNRPRLLPKTIKGLRTVGKIPVPWINLDLHPALKPYNA